MTTTFLLVILLAILFVACIVAWRELQVRLVELKHSVKTRNELAERFKSETDMISVRIEDMAILVEDTQERVAEKKNGVDKLEAELHQLRSTPKEKIYVYDPSVIYSDNLWEVDVVNPQFSELALGKRSPENVVREWKVGRTILISASTTEDARSRCAARFPSSLGYHVREIKRFREARSVEMTAA